MSLQSSLPTVSHNTLLIVGNGLNRAIDNSAEWKQVIDELIDETGYRAILKRYGGLPSSTNLVTLYQELSLRIQKYATNDLALKELVANRILSYQDDIQEKADLHRALMNLPCQNICTTNYDYVLEDSIVDEDEPLFRRGNHKETTFSLYRRVDCPGQTIWHIHGEADYPQSINLGHNQYAGYLHRAREYLVTGFDSSGNLRSTPLLQKLDERGGFNEDCWLDHFFSRKVIWLGFSLCLPEYVLWWLVFYRAELTQRFHPFFRGREMHFVDIHDPRESAESKLQRLERNRMLETSGVTVHEYRVAGGTWSSTYKRVIRELHG